jgi:hypothetical protein
MAVLTIKTSASPLAWITLKCFWSNFLDSSYINRCLFEAHERNSSFFTIRGISVVNKLSRPTVRLLVICVTSFVNGPFSYPSKTMVYEFLSCASNKHRFIYELSKKFDQKHFNVIHASGDADVLIVKTAIRLSEDHVTVLVGDDTDLFVLLCCHALPFNKKLYFSPEPKKGGTATAWDICTVKLKIGHEVSRLFPVAHAMLGCDTTSRVYGLGKGLSVSKLVKNMDYRREAAVFLRPDALHSDITAVGERAMGSYMKLLKA